MKPLIFLTTLTLFTHSLLAATNYSFKPEVGKLEFKTKGWPNLITIKGEGKGVTGTVTSDDGKVQGALSFDLTTLKTGIDLRDDHMKNKYLQVKEHPTAELTLQDVALPPNMDGSFSFKGMMKLHGVEKEVTGKGEMGKTGGQISMKAEIPIKLSDFNVEIPSYQGITVAEKVTIHFETQVTQQ